MTMLAQQVDVQEQSFVLVNRSTHVCPDCGKEFGSGKAMGGHRRSHNLVNRKQVSKPNERGNRSNFQSAKIKILYKKLNPKRVWTGSQESEKVNTDSIAEFNSDRMKNSIVVHKPLCVAPLQVWGATGKRSAISSLFFQRADSEKEEETDTLDEDMLDEDTKDTIEGLLLLSQQYDTNSTFWSSKSEEQRIEPKTEIEPSPLMISETPTKKRKFSESSSDVIEDERKFVCNICSKSFGNPQALGGHKSSHTKPAKKLKEKGEESVTCQHRCNVCDMTFATGMALGGHKRMHRNVNIVPVETVGSSSGPAPPISSIEEVTQPSRVVFDYDLNELPPVDYNDKE